MLPLWICLTCGLLLIPSVSLTRCTVHLLGIDGPVYSHTYERNGKAIANMSVAYTVSMPDTDTVPHNTICLLDNDQLYGDHISTLLHGDTYLLVSIRCPFRLKLDSNYITTFSLKSIVLGRLSIENCDVGSFLAESLKYFFGAYGLFLLDSALYISQRVPTGGKMALLDNIGELTLRQVNKSLTLSDLPWTGICYNSVVKLGLIGLNIEVLPDGLDRLFPRLQVLSLYNNSLTSLPHLRWSNTTAVLPNSLYRTARMKTQAEYVWQLDTPSNDIPWVLDLTSNKISNLTTLSFPQHLNLLLLGENQLQEIQVGVFQHLNQLQALDLYRNQIRKIRPFTFVGLLSLSYLYLSDNSIRDIEHSAFGGLSRLRLLHLGGNALTVIHSHQFVGLSDLSMLILDDNYIHHIDANVFRGLPSLGFVKLSHNPLGHFPAAAVGLSHLQVLNLSYTGLGLDTFITALSDVPKACLSNRLVNGMFPSIALRGNNISSVYNFSAPTIPWQRMYMALPRSCLDITENNISCDCNMASMLSTLKFIETSILGSGLYSWNFCWEGWICNGPLEFSGTNVFDLDPSRLYCPSADERCPDQCVCNTRFLNAGKVINCEQRHIAELPTGQPSGLLDLRMSENDLRTLQKRDYLDRIERLYLSNNSLTTLPVDVLLRMTNLTHLDISFNQLTDFPVPITKLDLKDITMGGNPFRCSCENIWFKTWLVENKAVVRDWDIITCHVKSARVERVLEVTDDTLGCSVLPNSAIVVGLGLASLCLLLGLVAALHYRQELRVLWFIHHTKIKTEINAVNKDFHAFIVFSDDDRAWTYENVIKEFYRFFPESSLALGFDDFHAGQSMMENLQRMLDSTVSVIIILSSTFLTDKWCRFTLHQALTIAVDKKVNFVTLINLDNMKADAHKEDVLNNYLRLKRYLNPNARLFPQKLMFSIFGKKKLSESCSALTNPQDFGVHEVNKQILEIQDLQGAYRLERPNFLYDIGLLYGDSDRHWVIQYLLEIVEREGQRVCLPDRDPLYAPGAADTDNILALLTNCRVVLLLLSEEFLKTERCTFCFRAATGKLGGRKGGPFLVVLLKEDVGKCTVGEIDNYINTYVCLRISKEDFAHRLLRTLRRLK